MSHLEDIFTSEATTDGVHISVQAVYDPSRSHPEDGQWFFLYTIHIANRRTTAVQLLSRHWIIRDETGKVEEVRGPGVVGEQPVILPGSFYEYTSGCSLETPLGTMEGSYHMVDPGDGSDFDAKIAPFVLSEPLPVN